ncbi:HD domain-containing protein [Oculatella sp. LEGE 06141]|uniref:HD domain-containing protein n=1 Tax=Oculatella sp. LEGE 06141 TaxID=1828648 RepID=UPI00187E1B84|nr:HD domain-containing protein [Oculatella sp. LEGE 06141]MBE9178944.1 HD domain-containing protein [Oculatella sp. LEGE 06141]
MIKPTVGFTRMDQGTAADWQLLDQEDEALKPMVVENVLKLLRDLAGIGGAFPIDRYQHSLQSATRAYRDGAEEEMVVVALLHDIGDTLALENHSELAAAILRPYVSENHYWLVKHHGLFQGYYYFHFYGRDRNERDRYRDHPAYQITVDFCEQWDQRAFDPDYDTLPLSFFEPMVRRLFARGYKTATPVADSGSPITL